MTSEIKKILPGLKTNIELKKHTTFKIGGPAKYFFIAQTKGGLIKAIKTAKEFNLPFFILGGGSNVLALDKGFKGLVINFQFSIATLRGVSRYARSSNFQKDGTIYTGAGVKLDDLVKLSLKNSLTGLEWAAGLPGTIGGAVFGNAAAFGFSTGDTIESVEALNADNLKIEKFSKKDCGFSNKETVFKKKKNLIILSAVFKLKKGDKKEIQKKIKENLNYRKKNHPFNFPSAGCAFKNPKLTSKNQKLLRKFPELKKLIKGGMIPAAFLIEKCGLKGKKTGRAEFSKKHANFIVNLGGAKAKDVIKLIKIAKRRVENKFGIDLEEEIQIINN